MIRVCTIIKVAFFSSISSISYYQFIPSTWSLTISMKGGYFTIAAFAVLVVMVSAEDHTILPIPQECPEVDSPDYTVHLKHENDCTKFYKCSSGKQIEMSCPKMNKKGDRLHFNALLQVCDWPNRAGCIGTTKPVDIEPTTPSSVWNSTWDCKYAKDGVMIPHETRCYLFYKCVNHSPKLEYCAEGLSFDPYRQICDTPTVADCVVKNVCKDYRSNVGQYFADPNSCKHVYYCKGITTARYVCDEDAEWSVDVEKCLPKEKAHCVRRYDY